MQNKKYIMILAIVMFQFFFITGLWAVDIGASGMTWEAVYGEKGQAQGLGFIRTANQQYHIGLGMVYIIFLLQTIWLIGSIMKVKIKGEYDNHKM